MFFKDPIERSNATHSFWRLRNFCHLEMEPTMLVDDAIRQHLFPFSGKLRPGLS